MSTGSESFNLKGLKIYFDKLNSDQINELIKTPGFPKPFIYKNMPLWSEHKLNEWCEKKFKELK